MSEVKELEIDKLEDRNPGAELSDDDKKKQKDYLRRMDKFTTAYKHICKKYQIKLQPEFRVGFADTKSYSETIPMPAKSNDDKK